MAIAGCWPLNRIEHMTAIGARKAMAVGRSLRRIDRKLRCIAEHRRDDLSTLVISTLNESSWLIDKVKTGFYRTKPL